MAMSAARWSTTSTPSIDAATCSGSRMSPSTTSAWPSRSACAKTSLWSSQPSEPLEL